jgi:hypothetical protein
MSQEIVRELKKEKAVLEAKLARNAKALSLYDGPTVSAQPAAPAVSFQKKAGAKVSAALKAYYAKKRAEVAKTK